MQASIRTGAFATPDGFMLLDELQRGRRANEVSVVLWDKLAQSLKTSLSTRQCVSRLCHEDLRFCTIDEEFAIIERIREVFLDADPARETSPRQTRASTRRRVAKDSASVVSSAAGSVFSRQTFVKSIDAKRTKHIV